MQDNIFDKHSVILMSYRTFRFIKVQNIWLCWTEILDVKWYTKWWKDSSVVRDAKWLGTSALKTSTFETDIRCWSAYVVALTDSSYTLPGNEFQSIQHLMDGPAPQSFCDIYFSAGGVGGRWWGPAREQRVPRLVTPSFIILYQRYLSVFRYYLYLLFKSSCSFS